jgi:ABC-type transport system involved in multi-copper enzyme maturation permease subunit
MPTDSITERIDQGSSPGGWRPGRETAPSLVVENQPVIARIAGLAGLMLVVLGTLALVINAAGQASRLPPTLASLFLILGIAGMLVHATVDAEQQIRRAYGALGLLLLVAGAALSLLPIKGPVGTQFLPWGFLLLTVSLLFLMPFVRNETDAAWRQRVVFLLGIAGLGLALTGFIGGNVDIRFLMPYGLVLPILGLAFLWTFVGALGTSDDTGYRGAQVMGFIGALVIAVSLGRSILPGLFYKWHWLSSRPDPYFLPAGLLLLGLGLIYLCISYGMCSDHRLIVLARRELAFYFYSPIAYIVFFCLTVVAWYNYTMWASSLFSQGPMGQPTAVPEPILGGYVLNWWSVFVVVFVVPLITMRLLSEERRTGTFEVLFTAPLGEVAVVLSKFIAAFVFFLLLWLPWGLFLIAVRAEGGQPFEYRPLIGFFLALAASGAGFIGMGLFFSSCTRNQIAAAVLTVVGMLGWFAIFWGKQIISRETKSDVWKDVLTHISYVDLWITSIQGQLDFKSMTFHLTAAVFWLFLTVKVLESRKWR